MNISIGTGRSNKVDGYEAGLEAATTVRDQLAAAAPDFAFVFCTIGYELEDVLDAVQDTFGDVQMSGATYERIIGRGYADESMYSLQVVGFKSENVHFHNFQTTNAVEQPLAAGESIGRRVAEVDEPGNRVLFLFPDFRMNITELFEGIENHCSVPLIGGTSGDNFKFERAYQFHNGEVTESGCNAVLMAGDFELMTTVTHGSEPLGDPRTVTRSDGNVIYEIDGRPALDVASEGFGEAITPENLGSAIAFMGIGFKTDASSDFLSPYIVRAIHGFGFEDKTCQVPTTVPNGSKIQFMRRDPHSVLNSGRACAKRLTNALACAGKTPALVCQFDCSGRGKIILGDDAREGVAMIQAEFDDTVPWMGAFTYGEISPIESNNYFHNFTATLAVFY
jgi:hypothetical protein